MGEVSPTRGTLLDSLPEEDGARGSYTRGTTVGRYVVLEEVGAGGMGVVYAAYDPDLDRRVALKIVQPRRLRNADALTRMVREAQALAKLAHPNVVAVHDVGEARGGVFVAMEFVRGRTLTVWRAAVHPTWREILAVMLAVGNGLAAAHDQGLVHRDIKPDNVMIDEGGRVRVMDFGLARASTTPGSDAEPVLPPHRDDGEPEGDERSWAGALGDALTGDGAIMGTPGYMAPEQFGGAAVDAPADQFAYCVTLWEALYGQRPFRAPTVEAMAIAVTSRQIIPPPRTTEVPAWVHRVLLRGLEVAPASRWPSMRALLGALADDPGPRRRRWLLATAAVAVGGAIVAGAQWSQSRRTAACAEAAAAIDERWNPTVSAAVHDAITRAGLPDPDAMVGRATPWFDRYAQSWREAATEVCVAGTIDGRFDAQIYARAEDCLTERAAELDELVNRLLAPSPDVVREAISAASSLTPVASCKEASQLARLPLIGDDRRADATAVRELLARAAVVRSVGDPDGGLTQADAALSAAQALEFEPLIARAHLERGAAYMRRDEGEHAQTELRAAYRLAAASGADEVAADASRRLVFVTGYQLENHDASSLWYDVAEALLDRVGTAPGDERRAALMSERAAVRSVSGKPREARDDFEQVLAMQIALFGDEHPNVITTMSSLSIAEYHLDNYAAAEQHATRALELQSRIYGEDHPERAMLLSSYAAVLESMGRHDESVTAARQALAIQERAFGSEHPAVAGALNNLAMSLGPEDEAIALIRRSLAIIEKTRGAEHREAAYCRNNLGHLSFMRGDFATAVAEHTRAAAILEATGEADVTALSQCLYNLGAAHDALQQADESERAYLRALPVAVRAFGEQHPFVAVVQGAVGRARVRKGDYAGSIAPLEIAIAADVANAVPAVDEARDRMYLARAEWKLGKDVAGAKAKMAAAVAVFEKNGAAKHVEIAKVWLAEADD